MEVVNLIRIIAACGGVASQSTVLPNKSAGEAVSFTRTVTTREQRFEGLLRTGDGDATASPAAHLPALIRRADPLIVTC